MVTGSRCLRCPSPLCAECNDICRDCEEREERRGIDIDAMSKSRCSVEEKGPRDSALVGGPVEPKTTTLPLMVDKACSEAYAYYEACQVSYDTSKQE